MDTRKYRLLKLDLSTSLGHIVGDTSLFLQKASATATGDLVGRAHRLLGTAESLLELIESTFSSAKLASGDIDSESFRRQLGAATDRLVSESERLVGAAPQFGCGDLVSGAQRIHDACKALLGQIDVCLEVLDSGGEWTVGAPTVTAVAGPATAGSEPEGRAELTLGRLLVVDDDDLNRRELADSLARLGYETLLAEHGLQALEILGSTTVDLVLLDLLTPELDGYDVLERRQSSEELRRVPFIVMSPIGEMTNVIRCIKLGADDYLVRPFDPVILGMRIGAALEKKRLREHESRYLDQLRRMSEALVLENQRRTERGELLLEVMRTLSSELDLDPLLRTIVNCTTRLLRADRSSLFLIDRQTNELWSKVAEGTGLIEIRVPLGTGIAGHVANTGELVNIADAYQDERFHQGVDECTGYHVRTVLCVPMRDERGQIVGVLECLNKQDGLFTAEDEEILAVLASQATIALGNARRIEAREAALRQQIAGLRIEVDQAKQAREITAIADTEFFHGLKQRVSELRKNRSRPT